MHLPQLSALLLSVLLAPAPSLGALDCKKMLIDGHTFDLSSLSGPHSIVTSRYESAAQVHHNTTYTLDVCKPLKKSGKGGKGKECPNNTRVCAIQHFIQDDTDKIEDVIAIAGALEDYGGSQFDYKLTRLKTSESKSDADKEGVRVTLTGGKHPLDGSVKNRAPQKAIIEFVCDRKKEGTEGEWEAEDKYDARRRAEKDDDKKDDEKDDGKEHSSVEHQLKKEDAALIWDSYGPDEKGTDILRLTWHTKHACEKRDGDDKGDDGKDKDGKDGKDGDKGGDKDGDKDKDKDGDKDKDDDPEEVDSSASWGFFTWFVIIVFLSIATYLIFGSWLNYTRYGARGWDLVPHGDTIRDVPYLMKDWTRRVLNTVQGTGSRGGYSAV